MNAHPAFSASTRVVLCALMLAAMPSCTHADEPTARIFDPARAADAAAFDVDGDTRIAATRASDPSVIERDADNAAARESGKSYLIPALEIVGFDFLLNRYNHAFSGSHDYDVTLDTIRRNLHHRWVADNDPFKVNQFLHPYQGSMYHGFARSAGLDYWESLGYTFAGSAFWEIFGENTPPSRNDQVASGIAGSFLGEALFRMANLMLAYDGVPAFWREVGAAAISPATGFNRLAFGNRFKAVFDAHDPARYSRFAVGVSTQTQNLPGTSTKQEPSEALIDYSLDYGLPGKPGYTYTRPFDYFAFQTTASSANAIENIMTRGLLYGTDYDLGERYRGIWGLYGSYDYIAPQVFRVSSTALSVGSTAQWSPREDFAMQGTGLFGVGYAGVGTINGTEDTDYHYGLAPQALAALRFIFGNQASLDVTAREYFVSRVAGASTHGHDNILRADTALTWRIRGPHAIALRYLWSRRDATYPDLGDRTQSRATIGLYYTLLGQDRFGAVDWR